MELKLDGRTVVLTGASEGIGRATAFAFADEGCRLLLCARRPEPLHELRDEIARLGVEVEAIPLDVTADDAPDRLLRAADAMGGADVLVNNVGGSARPVRLLDMPQEQWRSDFELNFFSAVRLALGVVPGMREKGWGRIVNIASTVGRQPDPWFGAYSASKAALINFTKNLSIAFSGDGVLANCVIPGLVETERIVERSTEAGRASGRTADEVLDKMMEKAPIPVGRPGTPREVAGAIVFLASEQASWISGSCLAVDGGTIRAAP